MVDVRKHRPYLPDADFRQSPGYLLSVIRFLNALGQRLDSAGSRGTKVLTL